jgi:transcriptional regulator with XRE-family HTH domain
MRGGDLIREARLRAGLTQAELSELSGRERSVIARWEQGAVSPSIDNLLDVVQACGFDLPLVLYPRDTSQDEQLRKNRLLTPERRARQMLTQRQKDRGRA